MMSPQNYLSRVERSRLSKRASQLAEDAADKIPGAAAECRRIMSVLSADRCLDLSCSHEC